MITLRSRNGIALFAALGVVTLLALLIAGTIASATVAQRSSQITHSDVVLGAAADFALTTVLADAPARGLADFPLGRAQSYMVELPLSMVGISATVTVTRLTNDVLWSIANVEAAGRDLGRRRISLIARWQTLKSPAFAPILSRGAVRLRGGLTFARDTTGDADCAISPPANVVVSAPELLISDDSVSSVIDPRAADSITYWIAAWQRASLDGARGITHVRGDTLIRSGAFEGILIVDGALTIDGAVSMHGLVIARTLVVRAALVLEGALLSFASSADAPLSIDLANTTVRFDPCIVSRAMRRATSLRAVYERSWSEVF